MKNEKHYFHRVAKETPTRFWINNPTLRQAELSIEEGAIGCTTNPSYISKILSDPEEALRVQHIVDLLVPFIADDNELAGLAQRLAVEPLAALFRPLYESSGGAQGLVTIQGDPFAEKEAANIIREGLESRKSGPNITVKIPVTTAGIEAIKELVKRDIPTMATEIMGISQAISICEAYRDISRETGRRPPFFVTHITGILDDHFKRVVKEKNISVSEAAMKQAGLAIAKKQYKILKERGYPGIMLGGGARKLEDFTELVGGDIHITINWTGTADILIEKDLPAVSRIDAAPEKSLIDELSAKLPDFVRAYDPEGMKPEEYYGYGGVELFRSSFMQGWRTLLDFIAQRRKAQ
jgi:transaldolase